MAKKRELPYREGTWFAVPLRDGGFAVGVAARIDGKGIVFGYFFGPRHEAVPTEWNDVPNDPADAIYRALFGDLGLVEGTWPVLGHDETWDSREWPLPSFVRVDEHAGRAWKAVYSEDSLRLIREEPCEPALAEMHPRDGLDGAGAVEIRLTKLLAAAGPHIGDRSDDSDDSQP